jgi:hypothetical protein
MNEKELNKKPQLDDHRNNTLTAICKQIRESDSSVMSLTISDANGDIRSQSYGAEYEREFLEKAAIVRSKAGVWAALMLGMEHEIDDVFGDRMYSACSQELETNDSSLSI